MLFNSVNYIWFRTIFMKFFIFEYHERTLGLSKDTELRG